VVEEKPQPPRESPRDHCQIVPYHNLQIEVNGKNYRPGESEKRMKRLGDGLGRGGRPASSLRLYATINTKEIGKLVWEKR